MAKFLRPGQCDSCGIDGVCSCYHDDSAQAAREDRRHRERVFISSITHLRAIDWPDWVNAEWNRRKFGF